MDLPSFATQLLGSSSIPQDLSIRRRGKRGIRNFTRQQIQARYRARNKETILLKHRTYNKKRRAAQISKPRKKIIRQLRLHLIIPKMTRAQKYRTDPAIRASAIRRARARAAMPGYKEKRLIYLRAWTRKKNLTDELWALKRKLRRRIWAAFSALKAKKDLHSCEILGTTIPIVRSHLEATFQPGMSWANHGKWHIDHIIPIYKAKTVEQLYPLLHYTNLRALWAKENLSRGWEK